MKIVTRFGHLLTGRRILWLDPAPDNNHAGHRFLRRAARSAANSVGIDTVATPNETLAALSANPYDVLITHWGHDATRDASGPRSNAEHLLEQMRARDLRCPVLVFSTDIEANERKARALALGAQDYCFRWESLLRALDRLLSPASQTA